MQMGLQNHDTDPQAMHVATDLQREMEVKLNQLKMSQIASQNQMSAVLESFKSFQTLISKIKEQEAELALQRQHSDALHQQLVHSSAAKNASEEKVRDLGLGLAEARAYHDELRADQQVKGSEISGLRAVLERTKGSVSVLDAEVIRLGHELDAKTAEAATNTAEVGRLHGLLAVGQEETWKLYKELEKEKEGRNQERTELTRRLTDQLARAEAADTQLRQQVEELSASCKNLEERVEEAAETLKKCQADLQSRTDERDSTTRELQGLQVQNQAVSSELQKMKHMCASMEDQWSEERTKLEEELATAKTQLQDTRKNLQTCTERLETSKAEANVLTALKNLLKEEAEKRTAEFKLSSQRMQLRNSARLFIAEFHRKTAEAAMEVSSEEAHQQRVQHAAELKRYRGALEIAESQSEYNIQRLKEATAALETMAERAERLPKLMYPSHPIPEKVDKGSSTDNGMVGVEVSTSSKREPNGKSASLTQKPVVEAVATEKSVSISNTKTEADIVKKATKGLIAERDMLARKLEQATRDGLAERAQLLQALSASRTESERLRRENRMNTAQVGSLTERVALLEKELVELKKSNAFASLAPNHAATAMRLRELEERSREAERRLRDAVEENVDLRERIESCEEVEMALRAAKEMLKSAEARVREAVEENSDLRKRLYKW